MNKAIVTGATGFIGRWLIKELLEHNVFVYAVVRNRAKAEKIFSNKNIETIECNLKEIDKLGYLINDRNIDVFYHLAWEGVSGEQLTNYKTQLNNLEATLKITEILSDFGIQKFIGAGSLHEQEVLVEMAENKISVNMGVMYKSAKLAAHYMAKVNVCRQNIDFIWPIITNTYGIGEKSGRLINSTIRKIIAEESPAFTKGTQNYDFVYISDVARAFYLLGCKGKTCKDYVIGSGNPKELRYYLNMVSLIVDQDIQMRFGEVPFAGVDLSENAFDISSLVEDTGYQPSVSFETGIKKVTEWIREGN